MMKVHLLALGLVLVLGACAKSGTSNASASASAAPAASAAATAAASVLQNGVAANDGGKVYQTNCSSCHQANGTGVTGVFPPLAGNPTVVGDPKTVIHIVKFGLSGKIDVLGQSYNGMMPNWGQQISDAEIANAITYIRSSWGNKASAVTESDVSAVAK